MFDSAEMLTGAFVRPNVFCVPSHPSLVLAGSYPRMLLAERRTASHSSSKICKRHVVRLADAAVPFRERRSRVYELVARPLVRSWDFSISSSALVACRDSLLLWLLQFKSGLEQIKA